MGKRKSDQWNHINNGPEFIIITIIFFLELCTGLGNWSWNSEMETDKGNVEIVVEAYNLLPLLWYMMNMQLTELSNI